MQTSFNWKFPYSSQKIPVLGNNIVSTSHPLAAQAGLNMLSKGGNAVDAAICTAITLAVVEPVNNGIGSDAFAIIWDGNKLHGLNASGKSPEKWTKEHFAKYRRMPLTGWDTVTIPGAVSAWVELWKKFGRLDFKELFKPAILYAKHGFLVPPIIANIWKTLSKVYKKRKFPEFHKVFLSNGRSPGPGELFRNPKLSETLELIADTKGEAFYEGILAEKIVEHAKNTEGLITLNDLSSHEVLWQDPLNIEYNGIKVHELPPNGQGLAALIALGILKEFNIKNHEINSPETVHLQIEAMKLAFADSYRYISDPNHLEVDPSTLIKTDYLKRRAKQIDKNKTKDYNAGKPLGNGDTVYLTTADENGMMVSYIQSNYFGFGSGIVIPNTGISLQNRGNLFTLEKGHPNQVGPSKRPFHTIIPAFVTKNGEPLMSFGVMGGAMQPQGHIQVITRIFDYGENPQAAIDAPRWRFMKDLRVIIERGFKESMITNLKKKGHQLSQGNPLDFGGAQIIFKLDKGYLAASEPRKDGHAVAY
ncbi:MAG: gamma-glutamyltransferase [Promethearchaeota archaeon]|nr:MAG: gamma-glutamyltransferase [Candidatus Lokiarchaeota archaeon]